MDDSPIGGASSSGGAAIAVPSGFVATFAGVASSSNSGDQTPAGANFGEGQSLWHDQVVGGPGHMPGAVLDIHVLDAVQLSVVPVGMFLLP